MEKEYAKEKPIIFNNQMVRAILDGKKTETRRVIKPQPCMQLFYSYAGFGAGHWCYPSESGWKYWGEQFKRPDDFPKEEAGNLWNPPFRADGILYVRETFSPMYKDKTSDEIVGYMYKEQTLEEYDAMHPDGNEYYWPGKWKPSIHMPKEAARIWMKINKVRVERLQEITEHSIEKEGLTSFDEFQKLWNSTVFRKELERYGWAANPWVWVVSFERVPTPANG